MFTPSNEKDLDMTTRRNFLQAGSLALSMMGLPSILEAAAEKDHKKSVIFIFLGGGISHQESFMASPDYTEKARSVNGYVKTKHGMTFGGHFTKLAEKSHLMSVVHSFGHMNPGHQGGTHYIMVGYNSNDENQGALANHPSYGSIVNRVYGPHSKEGIPHYVSLSELYADKALYLGNAYNPFNINEEGKKNLELAIDVERFNQRMDVLASLDKKFLAGRTTQDVDRYKRQGREMLLGKVRQVFSVENEPTKVREMYGKVDFAKKCLMARRLVENGVKFVTLADFGWDMHENIAAGYDRQGPELDHAVSTLLGDLEQRSLLDSTLVVITSEFSRTLLNKDGGRDHWPAITTLVLAGSKYTGGKIIGSISRDGMTPLDSPYKPIDLLATIMDHMEIKNTTFTDTSGRPRYILEGEGKII